MVTGRARPRVPMQVDRRSGAPAAARAVGRATATPASSGRSSRSARRRGRTAAWNGQPTIARSSRGGAPGIDATVARRRAGRASPRRAAACTGGAGAWNRASDRSPSRRSRPRTSRLPARTPARRPGRSCVTSTSASPSSSAEPDEQLEDLRLHHHVERGGRLVGEQHLRLAGQRHRDRGALAHAARELVRVPARRGGRDPDELEQLAGPRPRRGPPRVPCSSIGSTICDRTVFTGLSAFIAPWKTIAMSFHRCGLYRLLAAGQDVLPSSRTSPATRRVGGQQPHQREDGRGLAAARLADQPEPLAGVEVEADALHGVQLAALGQVEPDVQVANLERGSSARRPPFASGERPARRKLRGAKVRDLQPRVQRVLDRLAEQEAAHDHERRRTARRDDRPPGAGGDRRARSKASSMMLPPGDGASGRRGRGTRARSRRRSRPRPSGRCSRPAAAPTCGQDVPEDDPARRSPRATAPA